MVNNTEANSMESERQSYVSKAWIVGMLERICLQLELPEALSEEAKQLYYQIEAWFGAGSQSRLSNIRIFPHGSFKLGTTTKPYGQEEFDIDLICQFDYSPFDITPKQINRMIGDRFRAREDYANGLEPLKRGWRLKFRHKFNFDFIPAIQNTFDRKGGLLVPDYKQADWIPSHPKRFADRFDFYALFKPEFKLERGLLVNTKITPLSKPFEFKDYLKRFVQILKRHRDIYFHNQDQKLSPSSTIITALTAKAYRACVTRSSYSSEIDVLTDVLHHMNDHINVFYVDGKKRFDIPNETTEEENLADLWNDRPECAEAFDTWRNSLLDILRKIKKLQTPSLIREMLSQAFGESVVNLIFENYTDQLHNTRI